MFEVTERTEIVASEVSLADSEQERLASNLWSYVRYDVAYSTSDSFLDLIKGKLAPFEAVTKEGKLSKRFAKLYKEYSGQELTSRQLADVGSIIAASLPCNFTYDIVDKIDWQAGDFGDRGSCFWGGNKDAKDVIVENGGRAIRFFDDEGNGNGRAWVMPKDDNWVVFNAYGPSLEVVQRRIQAIYPATKSKMVDLTNWGQSGGLVYINSERGLLVSEKEESLRIRRIDLEVGYEQNACPICGDYYNEDNGVWIESEDREICSGCFDDEYLRCWGCDKYVRNCSAQYVDIRHKSGVWLETDDYVCDSCLEQMTYCEECNRYFDDMSGKVIDDRGVCGYCVKHNFHKCEECDEYIRNGEECQCHEDEKEEEEEEATPTLSRIPPHLKDRTVINPWDNKDETFILMIQDGGALFWAHPLNVDVFLQAGWTLAQEQVPA